MKERIILALALGAAALPASAGTEVGVSVSVNQPGVYGRIDIGHVPTPPVVVYEQPVVIERTRVVQQPIYLHVPPGHSKNWRKHCRRYDACGRPVYFVQEQWYQTQYVPAARHRHRDRDDHGHRGRGRDDHDRDHDHDRGHGRGHGHGKHKD
ncbi:MAG TPA: hypothetical protein VFZ93_05360 [Albitalea sp.]